MAVARSLLNKTGAEGMRLGLGGVCWNVAESNRWTCSSASAYGAALVVVE